jgi:hypothetical protein
MPCRGINVLLLWGEALAKGYRSNRWTIFKQVLELGARVRKGEHGSPLYRVPGGRPSSGAHLRHLCSTRRRRLARFLPERALGQSVCRQHGFRSQHSVILSESHPLIDVNARAAIAGLDVWRPPG